MLGEEILAEAKNKSLETEKKLADIFSAQKESSQNSAQTVTYDKYKKAFLMAGEKVSAGELVASRHFVGNIENSDIGFMLGKGSETTFEGKRLIKTYKEYAARDTLTDELNHELALALADKTVREDMFKSKAYRAIGERSGVGAKNKTDETNGTNTRENHAHNEQLGVIAEKMMQGFAEMISIDRPDLHLEIRPANAHQDVEEKIDFIISTKTRRRQVGVDAKDDIYEEHNFGIQFTVNTTKIDSKLEQIAKARERALEVDDILLVAIDSKIVTDALRAWEQNGKSIRGPWEHMSDGVKDRVLETLFQNVLKQEEIESLKKKK